METALSFAQVFVSPLVGTISDHYGPAILEKIGIKWDVTEEMEKLSVILLTIQEVLEDAEDKQTTRRLIRRWLRKLKDIACDVEDLLDECATEALHDPESTGSIDKAAMVERIKRVIDKFDKITEQRSQFNLFNLTSTTRAVHCRVDPRRETSSFPTELKVYGRDQESKDIVNHLVDNIAEDLSVYAIVGIAGLGKTTLAKMVYNDKIVSGFEIRRWVCVSENFEIKSLIGDIMQSQSSNAQTLDQLQHRLQNKLSGKRFLLILDDVWNVDPTKWSILKSSLTCGAKGSSIIVTTRSDKVASVMGILKVWHPKFLSEEDCFLLFKHHAFAEDEGDQRHLNLKSIGKEIVKRCGGVPLAAKALGGILRFLREEKEWLFVRNSNIWDLPQDKEDSILPALRLSYKHLPQHLRQCFGYCSIFPKDYRMEKEVLVQLWMANGFLQPEGNKELEDIGNGIFNDLLWRSLFQDVEKDLDGNVVACRMHDLVHDLARSITRDECLSVVTVGDEELVVGRSNTTRHLAVDSNRLFYPKFSSSMSQSFLRTFLHLGINYNYNVPSPLEFPNLMYLRVLDLRRTYVETFPVSIGELKLLRYLDLSETRIVFLPDEFFCNLRNLQTLKLRRCYYLEQLPESMSELTNLRHLDITGSTDWLLGMPFGMGQLKCLHMLSDFIASKGHGCSVGELQGLDHLGGTLAIRRLRRVRNPTDAKNANLIKKKNIRYLQLDWSDKFDTMPQMENEKLIAEALQPHLNIERLDFHHYGGFEFPTWMNSTCLSSLVRISLNNCTSCKHLPTLGLLPRLKVLKINKLLSVECIGDEFYSGKEGSNMVKALALFPALEDLELLEMPSLEEWKGWSSSSPSPSPSSSRMKDGEVQVSVFPVLKKLIIRSCPTLRRFPSLPLSIQHLELWECDEKIFERSLESLPHLYHLSIVCFPRWSPDQGMVLLQNLTALQRLEIINCPKLVSLPEGMQNLTSLKHLTISRCDGLKSLNKYLQLLTNLHELDISVCPVLELLPDDFQNLTSLKCLTIERCDGLKSLNNCLQLLTNLHFLDINGCEELELLPDDFQDLVSLQHLKLKGLSKLGAVPPVKETNSPLELQEDCEELELLLDDFQDLVSLQHLKLKDLSKLGAVSPVKETNTPLELQECSEKISLVLLHNLTTLQRLEISCPRLANLPEGMQNLTSLKFLTIEFCYGLKSFNNCLQLLTNLHSLRIRYCPELELLPSDFQPLISLKVLLLGWFPKLEAVPVVGSSTLETISFSRCHRLKHLPEWITNQTLLQTLELDDCLMLKSLPEGFQQLTALQRLQIEGCNPLLHERCKEDTGEDWHKIAHIPACIIGSPAILKDKDLPS